MTTPAAALSWQVWSRNRAAVAAMVLYFALVAAFAQRAIEHREWVFEAAVPLAFAALFLLASFSFPEGDLAACASGFPRWMLTLPVRTRSLVFWPMLHACLAGAAAWLLPALLLFRPLGLHAAVFWPTAMIAAMTALLQALLWAPSPVPYLRVVTSLVAAPVLITCGVQAMVAGVPEVVLTLCYLALIPAAYGSAVSGLERARRGESLEWPPRHSVARSSKPDRDFPSGEAAQVWFEWRSGGLALPLTVLLVCVLLSLPLLWVRDLVPIQENGPRGGFWALEINPWLKLQRGILFLLPLLAAVFSCGRRRYDAGPRDPSMHPFLATRPIRESSFIRAKFKAAALSTRLAWGVMLLFVTGWLLLPARDGSTTGPLLLLLGRYCTARTSAALLLVLAMFVFWTWKNQVQGVWADVSGRRWLSVGAPFLAHTGLVVLFVVLVHSEAVAPPREPGLWPVPPLLTALLISGLAIKTGCAAVTVAAVWRRHCLKATTLVALAASWLVCVSGLVLALQTLAAAAQGHSPLAEWLLVVYAPICTPVLPQDLHSWPYLAAMAALFVPFSRLLLAPLALGWNRSR